jgi:MFS family permease
MSARSSEPSPAASRTGFRTFLVLWASQSVSVIGTALTYFAINVYLAQELFPDPSQRAQLAAALSAVALAFALPLVLFAPWAGAMADRASRRTIMIVTDLAAGCLSLVLAGLILRGPLSLPALIGVMAGFAALQCFHGSAFDASYAMIVPREQLARANGMMQTMWALSGVLSPGIAATLIALPAMARRGVLSGLVGSALAGLSSGTVLAISIDALTFFAAAVTLVFLAIPSPVRHDLRDASGKVRKSMLADIKEGALFIWKRRPLLWLLLTFAVINLCTTPLGVLQPLIVKMNLAADWSARGYSYETALALLASLSGFGGLIGGIFISTWGGLKKNRVYGVLGACVLEGIVGIVYGLSGMLFLSAGCMAVASFVLPTANAHSQAIWQIQTPRELQGRVFAVRRVIAQFTWPISTALAGWAAGRLDPGKLIAALFGIMLAFVLLQLTNKGLLKVEDRDYLERLAAGAGGATRGRAAVQEAGDASSRD